MDVAPLGDRSERPATRLLAPLGRGAAALSVIAALAGAALALMAEVGAGLDARAQGRLVSLLETELRLARLTAEAEALTRAGSRAHEMVARARLMAARQALASPLGGARAASPAMSRALDLAARIADAPASARSGRIARLRRLVRETLLPQTTARRRAVLTAAAEARARARMLGWAGAGLALAAVLAIWRALLAPRLARARREVARLDDEAHGLGRRNLHDGLTGLSSRRNLIEQFARGDPEATLAVLHLDIDNFRALNAGLGREVGDRVLAHVADILSDFAGPGESVARLEADAFVIATERRTHPAQLEELAVEVIRGLERRTSIAGHAISLSGVIGIAARATPEDGIERLLANAEIACARARKEGGTVYFSEEMGARLTARRQTAQELLQALIRDEIEPFFQPQIDLADGRLVGFEALARWRQSDGSVLTPYFFLEIAEDARLSHRITAAMLSKTLAALARWRKAGLDIPRVGLNVPLEELREPDFHDRLIFDLERLGLAPRDLGLEVLESALIESDDDPALDSIARLGASGFAIDLDDFGTGHASLSNLQRLAVDRIKIDRVFVRDLPGKPELRKVTLAMVNLARSLGITALAEGVETEDERRALAEIGVQQIQGFAIAKPMAADRVPEWARLHARGDRDVSAA